MPIMSIKVLTEAAKNLEELSNELAKMQKIINYLLEGNLDFDNIRAKGIVAENIDVDKLSAITADLGTITAGLIQSVIMMASEIYGSYIATAQGTYPYAEMSNTDNTFVVHLSATQKLTIEPSGPFGSPAISISDLAGLLTASIQTYTIFENSLLLLSNGDIRFSSGTDRIRFPSWTSIKSISPNQSLQDALNAKANAFSGFTGTVYVASSSGGSPTTAKTFVNGVCTS